ncbi:MAG: hypothetical protein JXA10_12115 [Anaerolineae bacterium]|nr:hypothetical protein [Anaerolineae bacterium]
MSKVITRIGIVVLVAVMAFGVIGTAAAQGTDRRPAQNVRDRLTRDGRVRQALLDAVVEATGLTAEDIVPQLRDGKTLAEILTENGLDPDVVLADVTAAMIDEVNQALADGTISANNAERAVEELPGLLEAAMNGEMREYLKDKALERMEDTALGIMADMAGMELEDLIKDVAAPPTLAEIAARYGLDPDAVIAELEARITENVNQAVANGEMTAEEAAEILDGLHDRLVERFENPFRLSQPDKRAPRLGNRDNRPDSGNTGGDV